MRFRSKGLIIILLLSIPISFLLSDEIFFNKRYADRIRSFLSSLKITDNATILTGTNKGLVLIDVKNGKYKKLWNEGTVYKILKTSYGYFFLSNRGIIFTDNLESNKFIKIIPSYKKLKIYDNDKAKIIYEPDDFIDIKVDLKNDSNLIVITKSRAYLSFDRGKSWSFLANPAGIDGIKSCSLYTNKDSYVVIGHSIKGVFVKNLSKKSNWQKIKIPSFDPILSEISDILINEESNKLKLYISTNFLAKLFKIDIDDFNIEKEVVLNDDFDIAEALFSDDSNIYFTGRSGLFSYSISNFSKKRTNLFLLLENFRDILNENLEFDSLVIESSDKIFLNLSNLWIVDNNKVLTNSSKKRTGVYITTDMLLSKDGLNKVIKFLSDYKFNTVVFDMKDDWGNLRFYPNNDYLRSFNSYKRVIDVDYVISEFKKRDIYLVARLVLFKDRNLFYYNNSELALFDKKSDKPWRPYVLLPDGSKIFKEEYWVDPYSEKVWEYNVLIAKELESRGFDEIQFDYIRFPTDGDNIDDYYSRYNSDNLEKRAIIESFFIYVRKNIKSYISIDIYGANGWYRSSCQTGQDIEMLKKYVDIICPMFYPSHFDDKFLFYPPFEDRPYRIYYYGNLRSFYIAKKNVIIRPWLQAFKLKVDYDKQFFSKRYIKKQIEGCDESVGFGYTFWNPSGKYSYLDFLIREN